MRRQQLLAALCMICGAFVVYCSQSVTNRILDGGANPADGARTRDGAFVTDAHAQSGGECCRQPAPVFVKLFEGVIDPNPDDPSAPLDTVIAVAGYRELVVYVIDSGSGDPLWAAEFRPDASAPFGQTGQLIPTPSGNSAVGGTRLRVDGVEMRLRKIGCRYSQDCFGTRLMVAGVQ